MLRGAAEQRTVLLTLMTGNLRAAGGKANGDGARKTRTRDRPRAVPAPEANAELQVNIDKRRLITHANAKSKSEKFPPPHQDGALGYPLGCSNHMEPAFEPPDPSSFSTVFPYEKGSVPTWSGPLVDPSSGNPKRKHKSGRSSKQPCKQLYDKLDLPLSNDGTFSSSPRTPWIHLVSWTREEVKFWSNSVLK
ncbi:hypothetical protein ABZP36_000294 [Zizania latifolia]